MSHPKNSSIFKIPFLETLFFSNSKLTKLVELYSPGSEKKTKNRKNHIIGSYDRRTLTGVSVEARLPQLPLFHGPKVLS